MPYLVNKRKLMPYRIHIHKKTTAPLHHVSAMIEGFSQILRMPLINFFIIFVITFALFLPAGFYVGWKNASALNNVWSQAAEISVCLKKNISPKAATNIAQQLKLNDAIMDLKLISPDEGMKDFVKYPGFGEFLLGIKENPLPYVIVIYPKVSELTEDQILALVDGLKNLPEVEATKIDMDWVVRSYRLLNLFTQLSSILTILLGIGALVVVCFTAYVTPQIVTNKINISKRVLQYQCFWHSLIGGLLAVALINFILMRLHNFGFVLQGLEGNHSIMLILMGVFLGVISSKFSIRHLFPSN
ncbi:cell division transport system permease protein [Gammaproteobacteria bacterium]